MGFSLPENESGFGEDLGTSPIDQDRALQCWAGKGLGGIGLGRLEGWR